MQQLPRRVVEARTRPAKLAVRIVASIEAPKPVNLSHLHGVEMAVEGGFPLGLSEDGTYSESSFRLNEGEQLTLMTDGVVEARGKDGELFGFARTEAISKESAEGIAQVAQSFGQDDDISVISVIRTAVVEAALA